MGKLKSNETLQPFSPLFVHISSLNTCPPPPTLNFAQPFQFLLMEDYDVDEEEDEVFLKRVTSSSWWEDCNGISDAQNQRRLRSSVVNGHSWAEELQDVFVSQAEGSYNGGRPRVSSILVSDCFSC